MEEESRKLPRPGHPFLMQEMFDRSLVSTRFVSSPACGNVNESESTEKLNSTESVKIGTSGQIETSGWFQRLVNWVTCKRRAHRSPAASKVILHPVLELVASMPIGTALSSISRETVIQKNTEK